MEENKAKVGKVINEVEAEVRHVEQELATATHKVECAVQKWIAEHLHNTAFSQDTGAWNVLQKALPHLVPAIVKEVG